MYTYMTCLSVLLCQGVVGNLVPQPFSFWLKLPPAGRFWVSAEKSHGLARRGMPPQHRRHPGRSPCHWLWQRCRPARVGGSGNPAEQHRYFGFTVEAELALLVAESAALGLEEALAASEARAADAEDCDFLFIGDGMSRYRHPAEDSHSEPEGPVELHATGSSAATAEDTPTTEPSAAALLARRVAQARVLGQGFRLHLERGTAAPRQAPWAAPLRSRCWAVLRGRAPEDVGIYPKWNLGAAAAVEGVPAAIV